MSYKQRISSEDWHKLKSKQKKIEKAIVELIFTTSKDCGSIYFDELGVTRLFVNETHNFKNVQVDTQVDKVLGINKGG